MECSPTWVKSRNREKGKSRSPRQLWNALLLPRLLCNRAIRLSQSPSIMECSPTTHKSGEFGGFLSQSPSIMECSPTKSNDLTAIGFNVAVPVNYGMLSYSGVRKKIFLPLSQSPSIMECSPTNEHVTIQLLGTVAVPVNYGMLSYCDQSRRLS